MSRSKLYLIPTPAEWQTLEPLLGEAVRQQDWRFCGFGPVAAAAATMHWLHELKPQHVVLVGIAGSYRTEFPLGTAISFSRVAMADVGAWQESNVLSPKQMGFAMWPGEPHGNLPSVRQSMSDTLALEPWPGLDRGNLLSVAAASGSEAMAETRATANDAIAEDMESYGVAMACALLGCPLTVLRGLSNRAGDRDVKGWKIAASLRAVADCLNTD